MKSSEKHYLSFSSSPNKKKAKLKIIIKKEISSDCSAAVPSDIREPSVEQQAFRPAQVIDPNNIQYCSYCFCADEFLVHESQNCSLQAVSLSPDYWPIGWPQMKTLHFGTPDCVMNGCPVNDTPDLKEHIKLSHSAANYAGPPLVQKVNDKSEPGPILEALIAVKEEPNLSDHAEPADSSSKYGITSTNSDIVAPLHAVINAFTLKQDAGVTSSASEVPNKAYKCGYCSLKTFDKDCLLQHLLHSHNANGVFVCEPCKFASRHLNVLRRHWKRKHSANDAIPSRQFITKQEFDESLMFGHDKFEVTSLRTSGTDAELNHAAFVKPEETVENYNQFVTNNLRTKNLEKCKFCNFSSPWSDNLSSHLSLKHSSVISETLIDTHEGTTSYRCVRCQVTTANKLSLAKHFAAKHIISNEKKCPLCELLLGDLHKWKMHSRSERHKENYRRSLRCKKCLFATVVKKNLDKHAIEHFRVPRIQCPHCDYKVKSMYDLRRHIAFLHVFVDKATDGVYHCKSNGCNFSSKTKDKLIRHSAVEHGSQDMQKLSCHICDFVTRSPQGYKIHLKRHQPERAISPEKGMKIEN